MNDLYKRMKERDESALDEFLAKYKDIFYQIVRSILEDKYGNSDIEDCLSESIIYIWYHIDLYNPDKCSLRNWAALIIRSRAINTLRYLSRNHIKLKLKAKPISSNESIEEMYLASITGRQILKSINSLKEPMKQVVFLKCIKGQQPKQIAKVLKMDISKVNYYLYEGQKKLKGMIGNG